MLHLKFAQNLKNLIGRLPHLKIAHNRPGKPTTTALWPAETPKTRDLNRSRVTCAPITALLWGGWVRKTPARLGGGALTRARARVQNVTGVEKKLRVARVDSAHRLSPVLLTV